MDITKYKEKWKRKITPFLYLSYIVSFVILPLVLFALMAGVDAIDNIDFSSTITFGLYPVLILAMSIIGATSVFLGLISFDIGLTTLSIIVLVSKLIFTNSAFMHLLIFDVLLILFSLLYYRKYKTANNAFKRDAEKSPRPLT